MQRIHDPSQSNVDNLNDVKQDASRNFRNEKKEYLRAFTKFITLRHINTLLYISLYYRTKTQHITTTNVTLHRTNNFNSQKFNRHPFLHIFMLLYNLL